MKRRQFLSVFALVPIAACSTSVSLAPPAISGDIDLVVNGLRSLLPYIVSATTATRYNSYLDTLSDLAKRVAAAQDANSSKSIVQQIIAVTSEALQTVATVKLPGIGNTVVSAIQVLLPIIASAVGILGYRTAPAVMSVEQARMVLARTR